MGDAIFSSGWQGVGSLILRFYGDDVIRQIDDGLYQTVCSWWKDRGAPPIPRELLPKRGYIVVKGDKPIIAGFLYKDETARFGMVEYISSDPKSTKEERVAGFVELMDHILMVAKEDGIMFLITTANHPGLIEKLKNSGFKIDCVNVTQLFREV